MLCVLLQFMCYMCCLAFRIRSDSGLKLLERESQASNLRFAQALDSNFRNLKQDDEASGKERPRAKRKLPTRSRITISMRVVRMLFKGSVFPHEENQKASLAITTHSYYY